MCEHTYVHLWTLCVYTYACVCPCALVSACVLMRTGAQASGWFVWCVLSLACRKAEVPSWAALGSGSQGPVCKAPEPSSRLFLFLNRHICACLCLTLLWVLGSQGCVGPSCQLGLWCNLPAEPLPELRVPLGVGKLPSANSPAGCLLEGRTHLPALRPHPQEVLGLGGRRWGRCRTACPALRLWPHRPGCAVALLPTAPGTSLGPGALRLQPCFAGSAASPLGASDGR